MKILGRGSILLASVLTWASSQSIAAPAESPRLGSLLGEFSFAMGVSDPVCKFGSMCFNKGGVSLTDIGGTVSGITLYWDEKAAPSSVAESRTKIRKFLPRDAVLTQTYSTKQGSIVDVYLSKSLAKKIPAKDALEKVDGTIFGYRDSWSGEKPGTFMVLHKPRIKTALHLGNNP